MAMRFELVAALLSGATVSAVFACGGAPVPAESSGPPGAQAVAQRDPNLIDDCAEVPGEPPPEPLIKKYEGVAAAARCQREVYTIMGGLTHFLGVKCEYCHVKGDYPAMTHNKSIANWMARELIPSLEKRGAKNAEDAKLWCNDCHVVKGKGTAKILGNPRKPAWAVEWMTTHLTDNFQRATDHKNLLCKDCHGANLGSPEFRKKIILTEHLPSQLPKPIEAEPAPAAAPEPAPPEANEPAPSEAPADAGAPDSGS